MTEAFCPCHSNKPFKNCCAPFLDKRSLPKTAEQLMRSRYSAYFLKNQEYIAATWHSSTRPQRVLFDADAKWSRLIIKRTIAGTMSDIEGQVEFVAIFKIRGRAHRLHELSRFIKDRGQWFYLDGESL